VGIIGIGFARSWAKGHLAPIVAKELSKTLQRPVNLGEIEDIWFDRIQLTNAFISVHGNDLNQLKVRDITINFNPFDLLFKRSVKLDIEIAAPDIYLAQNSGGSWLNIPTQKQTSPGPIKIEVGTIKIENGQIAVLPYGQNPQPIRMSKINLQADVDDSQQQVKFIGGGQFSENGQVRVQGNSFITNGKTELVVDGSKLDAVVATRVVKIPEVQIDRGTVDGNLSLAIEPGKSLRINSKLLVNNGKITINNVPRSLAAINGWIEVSERAVKFNNVTTKYDRVAGVVNGTLNYYTGYQLTAKTTPISLPDIVKSIDVISPFSLAGTAIGTLALTGKLDRPILTGKFQNSQLSQVDRVQIDRVSGNFKFADNLIKIAATAQPKLGGKVSTQGEIQLLKTPQTRFQVQASQVPGDTLSRLYGANLPPQVKIGAGTVRGTIEGAGNDIYTNLHVDVPQASYPGVADLRITPQGNTIVRSATFAAAGGKVLATGEVTRTNWRFNLQPQAINTQKLAKIGGIDLPANYDGLLGGSIQAAGVNTDLDLDLIRASGRLNLQLAAGEITANRFDLDRGRWQANVSSEEIDLQALGSAGLAPGSSQLPEGIISGNFNLSGDDIEQVSLDRIRARGRGKIELKAGEIQSEDLTIDRGDWQGIFTTKDLQLAEFNDRINGRLTGEFKLAGNLAKLAPASIRGIGRGEIDLPQGKIRGNHLRLDGGKWQGNFQSNQLVLGGLAPEIPLEFKTAKLDSDLNIAGNLQHFQPQDLTIAGAARLSLDNGSILTRQLEIKAGKWRGNFEIDRLKLDSVSNNIPPELATAELTGNFAAAGELNKLTPDRIQAIGNGELDIDGSKIRASSLKLDGGNWSSQLAIVDLKLGTFDRQLSSQLQASKLNGKFNVSGTVDKIKSTAIQASGYGEISLTNGGIISANNLNIIDGGWQADLGVRGLMLGTINQELPAAIKAGLLFGQFRAIGNLNYPDLEQIQANGSGQIRNILGGNIQVDGIKLNRGRWESKIIADKLNIGELAKFAPKNINVNSIGKLAGRLSANWQVGGNLQTNNLANLRVLGQTKLTNLQVGILKFDPNLIGTIQANPGQGVDIAFAGKTDRLSLSLDRNLQPQTFAVRQQGIIANGNVDRQILTINVDRLPIPLIQPLIPPTAGIQPYRFDGIAKGNLAINLNDFQVTGKQIEITNPVFGAFTGDRLLTNFRYTNGQLNLNQTEIQRGENTYNIAANIDTTASTPSFDAQFQVPKGSIEDIRDLLQIFSLGDVFTPFNQRKYGTAADLSPQTTIANRPQPLYTELHRISELRRWLNQTADLQQANSFIPDIGNLQGDFSGEISIANSLKTGLSSNFNINGSNWQFLGTAAAAPLRYHLDQIQAQGSWNDGRLRLDPLKLTIDNSRIDIAGDFGLQHQTAKVKVENVPTEWLTSLIKLPVDIKGGIFLTAEIGGDLANPRASGQVSLANGQLNNTKLQDPQASFNYWDGRLNFTSDTTFADNTIIDPADRIKITGSIPYQLPFCLKPPASQDIRINLSLQDRGLQILDVLSQQQLHWIDGTGKIALNIDGKMKPTGGIERLTASGTATINNGKIKNVHIPAPISEINTEIIFDFDRLDVQKFTGKLATGAILATGILPISDSFSIDPQQQLNIRMSSIPIDLKDKYKGNVDGNINLVGTALSPILTGDIRLSNGQIFLPDTSTTTATGLTIPLIPTTPNPNAVQFRNLQLILGDNTQITRAPILNFLATGKIDIDGSIDNLRPFGQVQLQKGSVNLFTTQFRLASGAQTADFFPTLGMEPVLNLRLYAKTLSSTANLLTQRNTIARTAKDGEINQPADFYTTSLGSVQTVQVEARIAGLASQLTQKLELTSTPTLTQPEIVLLLGGAIVQQISAGESIGLGVASVAGSNLLNSIQDRISDLFSLSDFRLFPTIIKDSKTSSNSTLGIAAEVGTDITPKISTSVFKILTNNELPYYSLRYRLNDQILLRGSTNLYGENRVLVEFDRRF
jgi:translocation and assembly module TamB